MNIPESFTWPQHLKGMFSLLSFVSDISGLSSCFYQMFCQRKSLSFLLPHISILPPTQSQRKVIAAHRRLAHVEWIICFFYVGKLLKTPGNSRCVMIPHSLTFAVCCVCALSCRQKTFQHLKKRVCDQSCAEALESWADNQLHSSETSALCEERVLSLGWLVLRSNAVLHLLQKSDVRPHSRPSRPG